MLLFSVSLTPGSRSCPSDPAKWERCEAKGRLGNSVRLEDRNNCEPVIAPFSEVVASLADVNCSFPDVAKLEANVRVKAV
jgi:hypothetical protein